MTAWSISLSDVSRYSSHDFISSGSDICTSIFSMLKVGVGIKSSPHINAFPSHKIAGFSGNESKPNLLVSAKLPEHIFKTMKLFRLKPGDQTDFKYPVNPHLQPTKSARNNPNMEELYQDPFAQPDDGKSDAVQRDECYAVYKPKVKVKFRTEPAWHINCGGLSNTQAVRVGRLWVKATVTANAIVLRAVLKPSDCFQSASSIQVLSINVFTYIYVCDPWDEPVVFALVFSSPFFD